MNRRDFLSSGLAVSLTVAVAGCSSGGSDTEAPTDTPTSTPPDTETSTPTETPADTETPEETETETPQEEDTPEEDEEDEEQQVDRPANYRWDLKPGRNDALRSELDRYVSSVGGVVRSHPAFEFSTDRANDDHTVDFEALKMYRDSNFDIMVNDPNYDAPMEDLVAAFVDDSLYQTARDDDFIQNDADAPSSYSIEDWLNAETVEESLDLGHNLLVSIFYEQGNISNKEQAAVIREAYQRHHEYTVLAWGVPMERGSLLQGMMYSPDDDKVRTFNTGGDWSGGGEAQVHAEIQDWRVIDNPENFTRGGDPADLHHPVLFHTDEWDRQGISFEDAKDYAVGMVYGIANDAVGDFNGAFSQTQNVTMTTGATEQLTRTLLDYNKSGVNADFGEIWNLASFAVGKYIDDPELNGVIDTVGPDETTYAEYFDGGFAFYEVENEDIVDEVRWDQSHEYDNFAEVYDELDGAA